jgi:acyl carrier protein phosphodiesterase
MLPFMIKHDWLYNYQFFEGIQQVMHGMSRRTKFNSRMDESVVELRQYHDEFEDEFMTFFPDLINFSKEFIQKEN